MKTETYQPLTTARARERGRDGYMYAAGVDDTTGTNTALTFSRFAAREAEEYATGETTYLASVQEQYARFTRALD